MLHEHPQAHAVNSMGQKIFIGPVPGVGEILNVRKVDRIVGDKIHGIAHVTKMSAAGTPVEYRATVNGWVPL